MDEENVLPSNPRSEEPLTPSSMSPSISRRKQQVGAYSNGHTPSPSHPNTRDRPQLLSYAEIPGWYKDNEYILRGHRPESFSASSCFASWGYIHNETFNIYSHLISAIIFLVAQILIARLIKQSFPEAKAADYVIFAFFLATAFITLSTSFLYHTLMKHSICISNIWLRLDFTGILFLTLGDFVSGIYLVFYCEPTLQKIYWAMILSLGLLTGILITHPRLQGLKWRALRVGAFVGTGLSGFAPLAHGVAAHGWDRMWVASGMPYYLLEGGILLVGALSYATRFPESVRPGKFDIWGCSHNIFHVLVVIATIIHLVGIWEAFGWNYRHRECSAR